MVGYGGEGAEEDRIGSTGTSDDVKGSGLDVYPLQDQELGSDRCDDEGAVGVPP